MYEWLSSHIADICLTALLVIIIAAIIAKLIRDRKNGRSSCGCDCGHCANSSLCRFKTDTKATEKDRK